jgi:hypothetical protein
MPQPTPYPQVPSLPGDSRLPASGAMSPSAAPIPPQVLTLPDVSWSGGFTGLGNPAEWSQRPNGKDIDGNDIVVPGDVASLYGPSVWLETTPGNYMRVAPQLLWDEADRDKRLGMIQQADVGGTGSPGGSWMEGSVNKMPSMEDYAAMDTFYKQFIPDWQTVDPRQWQAGVLEAIGGRNEAMLGIMRGGSTGMTEQDATRWQWEQQDRQQSQLDRVADAEYRQQALAQQAQQAAASAAAQRRAQAMSLAESILGMQQQQWAQISGWQLPDGAQTAPGWEPGGMVSQMFAKQGLNYTPIQAVQTPGVDYAPAYAWAQKLLGGS